MAITLHMYLAPSLHFRKYPLTDSTVKKLNYFESKWFSQGTCVSSVISELVGPIKVVTGYFGEKNSLNLMAL